MIHSWHSFFAPASIEKHHSGDVAKLHDFVSTQNIYIYISLWYQDLRQSDLRYGSTKSGGHITWAIYSSTRPQSVNYFFKKKYILTSSVLPVFSDVPS